MISVVILLHSGCKFKMTGYFKNGQTSFTKNIFTNCLLVSDQAITRNFKMTFVNFVL